MAKSYRPPESLPPLHRGPGRPRREAGELQRPDVGITIPEKPEPVVRVATMLDTIPDLPVHRLTEADLPKLLVWATPLLVEKFPAWDQNSITMTLRVLMATPTTYFVCSPQGFGMAEVRTTPWNPEQEVFEIFTVEQRAAERPVLLVAMAKWAKSINARTFFHYGQPDLGATSVPFFETRLK
jgi:hypothetical protein